ncbi:MAG: 4Fe-4S single cluster domain-containing protein [Patescibacteria group bacterium]
MLDTINVGAIEACTRAMGPGQRFCLWVRGCPLRCADCATPQFLAREAASEISLQEILAQLDEAEQMYAIQGVSFSGGEPFTQAAALAQVARHARSLDLSVLAWSGFTLAALRSPNAPSGAEELLAELDVLIDGPFIRAQITDRLPLRGSANQRLHLLTDRHDVADFESSTLEATLDPATGQLVMSGVIDATAARAILDLLGATHG